MTSTQKILLTWLAIGGGAAVLYFLAKNELKKAAEAVNPINPANVFNAGTIGLYQAVTGSQGTPGGDIFSALHPINVSGSQPAMYFVYDQNGNLEHDADGNLLQSPYAPGTTQNPYPNPHG